MSHHLSSGINVHLVTLFQNLERKINDQVHCKPLLVSHLVSIYQFIHVYLHFPGLFFQIFIQQRLSLWVLTEFSTSSKRLCHWAVKETRLSGEWECFMSLATCLPVLIGAQLLDPHATSEAQSALIECFGASLKQDSSAMQSTSQKRVSFKPFLTY